MAESLEESFQFDPNPEEARRRIRALMGYADLDRPAAAQLMGTSVGTFDRMIGIKGAERKTPSWEQLNRLAVGCGMPNWFTADWKHLST